MSPNILTILVLGTFASSLIILFQVIDFGDTFEIVTPIESTVEQDTRTMQETAVSLWSTNLNICELIDRKSELQELKENIESDLKLWNTDMEEFPLTHTQDAKMTQILSDIAHCVNQKTFDHWIDEKTRHELSIQIMEEILQQCGDVSNKYPLILVIARADHIMQEIDSVQTTDRFTQVEEEKIDRLENHTSTCIDQKITEFVS